MLRKTVDFCCCCFWICNCTQKWRENEAFCLNQPTSILNRQYCFMYYPELNFLSFFCSIFPCSPFAFLSPSTCLFLLFISFCSFFFLLKSIWKQTPTNQPQYLIDRIVLSITQSLIFFLSFCSIVVPSLFFPLPLAFIVVYFFLFCFFPSEVYLKANSRCNFPHKKSTCTSKW